MDSSRRRILAWLSGTIATFPLLGRDDDKVSAYLAMVEQRPSDSDSESALKWVRLVNTAEAAYFREFKRYVGLDELSKADVLRERGKQMVVPGPAFEWVLDVDPDGLGYLAIIRHRETGFAYRSDAKGLIFEGKVPPIKDIKRLGVESAFPPKPLTDNRKPPSKAQIAARRLSTPLAKLSSFFFPTLLAQDGDKDNDCPIMFGCGSCKAECQCAQRCCNWGTSSCVWCCSPTSINCC